MSIEPDKHHRYRQRCKSRGLCPHCGKPCRPYIECEERRDYKRKHRRQYINTISPDDPRFEPRGAHRRWDAQSDERLLSLLRDDVPLAELCGIFNRTPWAIAGRAKKLGQPLPECGSLLSVASHLYKEERAKQ